LYELIDNAFLHGHAGNCKIVIDNSVIQLVDNGEMFDTSKLSEVSGREGVAAMRAVMNKLRTDFSVNYKRENKISAVKRRQRSVGES
jgi:hypothetical protein